MRRYGSLAACLLLGAAPGIVGCNSINEGRYIPVRVQEEKRQGQAIEGVAARLEGKRVALVYGDKEEAEEVRNALERSQVRCEEMSLDAVIAGLMFDPSPDEYEALVYAGTPDKDTTILLDNLQMAYSIGKKNELELYESSKGIVRRVEKKKIGAE